MLGDRGGHRPSCMMTRAEAKSMLARCSGTARSSFIRSRAGDAYVSFRFAYTIGRIDCMMSGLNIFFSAWKYLTDCVRDSINALDQEHLKNLFSLLIEGRKHAVVVDGMGRSLQSLMLVEDCLEHNGFSIILPASNACLRPWKPNDLFFFNSGSASGSPITHAQPPGHRDDV
jgi:hypothetical protein